MTKMRTERTMADPETGEPVPLTGRVSVSFVPQFEVHKGVAEIANAADVYALLATGKWRLADGEKLPPPPPPTPEMSEVNTEIVEIRMGTEGVEALPQSRTRRRAEDAAANTTPAPSAPPPTDRESGGGRVAPVNKDTANE